MKAFWLIYLSCIANIAVVNAQAPVIVPKPGPIVLHLDATGNYKVQLSDVAAINGNYNSDSVTPANFNCSNVGSQTVIVYAANTTGNDPTVRLNYPYGIVCDPSGNIYVADAGNNQIKKITPGGIVSVFAGTGAVGSADGAGSIASFNRPWGITMDTKGNIYVADAGNNKIRKITSSGFVSTIAGSGAKGSKNDIGVLATFNNPAGVAVDAAGNLYIVDSDNNLIREITPDGSVSTFAGNGLYSSVDGTGTNAGFYDPHGIAIDPAGFLYIADGNDRIRQISPAGMVITFAGNHSGHNDGIGTSASFYFLIGIAIDAAGNLYVADTGNNLIRRVTAGGVVNTIVGNGSIGTTDGVGTNAVLNAPIGIALDPSGNLYVTDGPDNIIRKIAPDLKVTTLSLIGSNGSNTLSASLPVTVTVASQPVIASAYNNVTVAAYQNCSPTLPDYTLSATASDNCQLNAVTFTQLPVAGTPLTIGVPVNVTLTATDASGSMANISFAVNVINSTDKLVSFNSNPAIFAGNGIKLRPLINGDIANYSWLPANSLDDPTIKNPIANPSVTTTYTLTVTTTGGCTASADVTVTVLDQVMIPNAFTPNGDGINDFWNIAHLNEYPGCTVDIFGRNGQLIFHSLGYGKPWTGTYNGNTLPTGAYYYVIDLKDGRQKLSGQVTIIK
jgi:gliding motility-associated-like protein